MSTGTLDKKDKMSVRSNGEHDLFSHYALKKDIERSTFEGVEITALCGKKWRPFRDFTKYPVCGTCTDIYNERFPE